MIIEFLLLLLGFILLTKGSDLFVDGASEFARYLHIPQLIIGLTIVGMGTSAPEAAVSIRSALENSADLSIGNIVGSNILNILIILGICSLIAFIPIEKSTTKKDIPFMIFSTALLMVFGYTDASLSWFEGFIFLIWFIVYFWAILKSACFKKITCYACIKIIHCVYVWIVQITIKVF